MNFSGASNNENLPGTSVLNTKKKILKKINILFIVHFYLDKYIFSINTFWKHLVCYICTNVYQVEGKKRGVVRE